MFINATPTASGTVVARSSVEITLRQSFNLSAYEQQYLGVFWEIYLPGSPPVGDAFVQLYASGSWVLVARDVSSENEAVRKALLAVCLLMLGRRDRKQWMVQESLRLYTSALNDVRVSLSSTNRRRPCSDAVLVASRALSAYEVSRGSGCRKIC